MRGRALEKLLQYGLWVRRNAQDADLSELFQVVQLRFAGSPALALAEYALLGLSFYQLCELSASWTKENMSLVFPQSRADAWGVGFGTYLKFNRAHRLVFEMLSPHLNFAVDNLRLFKDEKNPNSDSIGKLGEHLLDYYLLGFIDLTDTQSLLQKFYAKTQPAYWAEVFDHLGRLLSNTSELQPETAERCKAFFEARLAVGNVEELKEFTFWLKAECLEPRWRLTALSRTLDLTRGDNRTASMLTEDLAKLSSAEPDLAVACFAKLTEGLINRPYFYLRPEQVKLILKTGLSSHNEETVEAAKFARDNLIKARRSEFRDLDAIKDDPTWV